MTDDQLGTFDSEIPYHPEDQKEDEANDKKNYEKYKSRREFGILATQICSRVFKKEYFMEMIEKSENTLLHISQ